jgi:PX domain.
MISRRKRMLQTFLNRLARHPILSNEHVFHRFLDGEVSWVRVSSLVLYRPANM